VAKKEKKHNTSPQSSSASPEELTDLERNVDLYAYTLFTSESIGLQRTIEDAERELKQEVAEVKQEIRQEVQELKSERKWFLGTLIAVAASVVAAAVAILATVVKMFIHP